MATITIRINASSIRELRSVGGGIFDEIERGGGLEGCADYEFYVDGALEGVHEAPELYQVTRRIEATGVVDAAGTERLSDVIAIMKGRDDAADGSASRGNDSPLDLSRWTLLDTGLVIERHEKDVGREAAFLAQHLRDQPTLWKWLEQFQAHSASGLFSADEVAALGFPLPDRLADALWCVPSPPQAQGSHTDNQEQFEWWQEDGSVLGFRQCNDAVMGLNHFTWFRIPLHEIIDCRRRVVTQMQGPPTGETALPVDSHSPVSASAFRQLSSEEVRASLRQYEEYFRWNATRELALQLFGATAYRVVLTLQEHASDDGSHYSVQGMSGYDAEGERLLYDFRSPFWQQHVWEHSTLLDVIDELAGTESQIEYLLPDELQAHRQDAVLRAFTEEVNAYDSLPIQYDPAEIEVDFRNPPFLSCPELFVPILLDVRI